MKTIKKYSPFIINTFNNSIFGKEHVLVNKSENFLVIPVFNLGISINSDNRYVTPAFIVFNYISFCEITSIPYQKLDDKYELNEKESNKFNISFSNANTKIQHFELESLAFRDCVKSYMTINVLAESCSIFYGEDSKEKNIGISKIDDYGVKLDFLNQPVNNALIELINKT
jgi:hypothetical protein